MKKVVPKSASAKANDLNSRIAQRVRDLRGERKLSLDKLADKCRVSRSMISLIERGKASATAVILEKLAAGLGVSLASLFENPATPPNPVSLAAEHTPWRDPQSGYVRRNLSPANFPNPIQLVDVELPAEARVHYDSTRDILIYQQIWVRTGTLEVTVGSDAFRLEEDDCLAMQLNAPTSFRNPTKKPVRYLVALVGDQSRSHHTRSR